MCKNQTTPATPQVDCPTKENIFHLCGKARIMEIAPVSPKSLYSPSYSMSTNCWGVQNITLVLQIMQMYHRCIAKYPRNYHYARTSFTARVTVRGMWTARSPRSNWQVAAARRWAGAALARRALHPGTRAHLHTRPGQLGIAQNSGQLWCCSCARCFDGTIIAEPNVSQLLAPGLSPARHSSPLSAAPATTKETSLMAQWLCQKNYQIRAQLVAKMEVSYQLTHGLSISIL